MPKAAIVFKTEDGSPLVRCSHCFHQLEVPAGSASRAPICQGGVRKKVHRGRRGGRRHPKAARRQPVAATTENQIHKAPEQAAESDSDIEVLEPEGLGSKSNPIDVDSGTLDAVLAKLSLTMNVHQTTQSRFDSVEVKQEKLKQQKLQRQA